MRTISCVSVSIAIVITLTRRGLWNEKVTQPLIGLTRRASRLFGPPSSQPWRI
jgi:hypothetical protein